MGDVGEVGYAKVGQCRRLVDGCEQVVGVRPWRLDCSSWVSWSSKFCFMSRDYVGSVKWEDCYRLYNGSFLEERPVIEDGSELRGVVRVVELGGGFDGLDVIFNRLMSSRWIEEYFLEEVIE